MSNTYQALLCDAEFLHNRMQSSCNKDEFRRLQSVWLRTAKGLSVNDISAVTCYSKSWVRQLHSLYRHGGIDALLAKEKGGRHNENLTVEEEKKFIKPFLDEAKSGGVLEIGKIHQAYEKQAEREVSKTVVYALLHRHGWRKIAPRSSHPKHDKDAANAFKKTSKQS